MTFKEAESVSHQVVYRVLPDYLCIGSDSDYYRVPMGPQTAQIIADTLNGILPTA
ncbi:MAG: hypothetical protein GF313_15070 [Caldithrix sp.]|nr:hypothetical protein [Caldithrix sp.]